jgi:proteasome assembly chaperone (PAC2) family protein
MMGKNKMENLTIYEKPDLESPSLVLGFSGWMDGGNVSTDTIKYLKDKLKAEKFADIDPREFYIFNLPGTMEQVAQFRPHARIRDGLLTNFAYPKNEFFAAEKSDVILFSGKEPNLRWDEYANRIFQLGEEFGVKDMYFVGSVAGATPHTREPRILCSVSSEGLKTKLKHYDVRFTNYEGPASITTLLNKLSKDKGVETASFVAEIPMYVQTKNPKGVEAVIRRLVRLLDINIDLSELDRMNSEFEKNMDQAVAKHPELTKQIKKLEENYDKELLNQKADFEGWLKEQGIDKL